MINFVEQKKSIYWDSGNKNFKNSKEASKTQNSSPIELLVHKLLQVGGSSFSLNFDLWCGF